MTNQTPQPELRLGYPLAFGAEVQLLPARIANEFVYCSLLAYLEWMHGKWADSRATYPNRMSFVLTEHN